jgi:uncharacterized integral membrane protein
MVKFILGIILGIAAIVFVLQNTQAATVTFLAWRIEMSLALLLIITIVVGGFMGWVLAALGRRRRSRS